MTSAERKTMLLLEELMNACRAQDLEKVQDMMSKYSEEALSRLQNEDTGQSALMVASEVGSTDIINILLQEGAVWNALDRYGRCAGNYASNAGHQEACDVLVHHAVRCEFLLGRVDEADKNIVEQDEYLSQRVKYTEDGKTLLDEKGDGVMMEWERPLMQTHAQIITGGSQRKRVLNVGFGMGIIDGILQKEYNPDLHVIIEAHPDVYERMKREGWDKLDNVRICFGKWQIEMPKLIEEGIQFDGIFFDTYGEHWRDMEDFHLMMIRILDKPHGVYSFFNGLSPDNIFFHGVACECAKVQLSQLGLTSEFAACEIKVSDDEWKGISRKYWFGDTYYLPIVTWSNN